MTKDSIRYLVLSDVHLGNPRNKTVDIIKALDVFFDQYAPRNNLDIIFIAGDLFDRLLDFPLPDVAEISTWCYRLIDFCGRNKIKLRILEGTPSHDWGQSEIFNTIFKMTDLSADIKYITTLLIEYIKDLDIHVLYIPDEWSTSTDKTFEDVKAQLEQFQIKQVDIAMLHGNFDYQLPPVVKAPKYKEADYLSVVKYFISIGHVHTHSIYERILAQGSFDRLAHGEEEPKGGMECVIYKNGTGEHYFIENKLAKIFKTILLKNSDIDNSLKLIIRKTAHLPMGSYIRIRAKKDHPAMIGFDEIKKKFPFFVMSKISIEEENECDHKLIDDVTVVDDYVPITITKDNIRTLLFTELNSKYSLVESQLQIVNKICDEVI